MNFVEGKSNEVQHGSTEAAKRQRFDIPRSSLSGNLAGLYVCHWHGARIRVSGRQDGTFGCKRLEFDKV